MTWTDPKGRTWHTLRALADAYGLVPQTLRRRLREGQSLARALRPVGIPHPRTGEPTTRRALAAEVGVTPQCIGAREVSGTYLLAPKRTR